MITFLIIFVLMFVCFCWMNGGFRMRRRPRVIFFGPFSIYATRQVQFNKPLRMSLRINYSHTGIRLLGMKAKPAKKAKHYGINLPITNRMHRRWDS